MFLARHYSEDEKALIFGSVKKQEVVSGVNLWTTHKMSVGSICGRLVSGRGAHWKTDVPKLYH
jgi:hypothetical protein